MANEPGATGKAGEAAGAPAQQQAAKPKPGGAPPPQLYARAFDRLAAASAPPSHRGSLILIVVLLLLAAGGYGLWRMGRLDPVLASIGAGIERVAPMSGPFQPTLERIGALLQGTPPAQSEAAMVMEIKKLLGQLDFQPGPMDGTLDDQTVAAIQSYQQTAGLPVDGKPSQALLEELRSVAAGETQPKVQPASN
jgi:peptidoglycan hydrolase-like protein with peptidoglycan-binding domain